MKKNHKPEETAELTPMEKLRAFCEQLSEGKFSRGITLMSAWHLIDIYNNLEQKKESRFIEFEIARILEDFGIPTKNDGIGWKVLVA